ncbi:hypothetical protein HY991_05160 [Candidatus Micrarchaeota archaeon]|nr:hypothetical protein [Candidatus Micrarchaeota archaeon]
MPKIIAAMQRLKRLFAPFQSKPHAAARELRAWARKRNYGADTIKKRREWQATRAIKIYPGETGDLHQIRDLVATQADLLAKKHRVSMSYDVFYDPETHSGAPCVIVRFSPRR